MHRAETALHPVYQHCRKLAMPKQRNANADKMIIIPESCPSSASEEPQLLADALFPRSRLRQRRRVQQFRWNFLEKTG